MNILITAAGRRGYIIKYLKEALRGKGQVIACNSEYTIALEEADNYYITQLSNDPEYMDKIYSICLENNIKCVLSLHDIDLYILSTKRNKLLDIGVIFIGPSPDCAITSIDKYKMWLRNKNSGIKTPQTYLSLEKCLKEISNGSVKFPIVTKPRFGMGSNGFYIANNQNELLYNYEKTSLNALNLLRLSDEPTGHTIIQEHIDGEEFGIEIYKDLDGNHVTTKAIKKISMRSGETDIGESYITDNFIEISNKISMNYEFTGIMSIDCILTNRNAYCIDINPRLSGHYPFSHLAGLQRSGRVCLNRYS